MVTEPVSDPPSDPPVGTTPPLYHALFKLRNTGYGREVFEGVCTLTELQEYSENNLVMFSAQGVGGNTLLSQVQPGDELRFSSAELSHWLQSAPPYDTLTFNVKERVIYAQGTLPQTLPGNRVILPGRTPQPEDVGQWIHLSGFSTTAYDGYAKILRYTGNVYDVAPTAPFTTTETGATWQFQRVELLTTVPAGQEPRYFPTAVSGVGWELWRATSLLTLGPTCTTHRTVDSRVSRCRRVTSLHATLASAQALMASTRAQVRDLQMAASLLGTSFTPIITTTYGP